MTRTKLVVVGGFLGAGKTTLLLKAAQSLARRGLKVGLITNDQGEDLVDTRLVSGQGVPVTEVAGGCFCCRFPDLMQAIRRLETTVAPDVILAEPVGSCTDLTATVLRPIALQYADTLQLAPLTILLDAGRTPADFPEIVRYLYDQQLAEAEMIALSKADLLSEAELAQKLAKLQRLYPHAEVAALSALSGLGLAAWLDAVLDRSGGAAATLNIDYERYAQAEAALGWLNGRGSLRAKPPFSAERWATDLLNQLGQALAEGRAPIAHVKLHLTTPGAVLKGSLTRSGGEIDWDFWTPEAMTSEAEFVLNARVNTDPETLARVVEDVVTQVSEAQAIAWQFEHLESFSPAPPQPTYRMV